MTYGLPYKGSKNKIANWVVSHFPHRTNFYDLFCGGCALYGRNRERLKYCVHTAIVDGNYDLLLNEYNIDLRPLDGIENINERRLLTKKKSFETVKHTIFNT